MPSDLYPDSLPDEPLFLRKRKIPADKCIFFCLFLKTRLIWYKKDRRTSRHRYFLLSYGRKYYWWRLLLRLFLVIPTNVGIGPQGPTAAAVTGERRLPTFAAGTDPGKRENWPRVAAGAGPIILSHSKGFLVPRTHSIPCRAGVNMMVSRIRENR